MSQFLHRLPLRDGRLPVDQPYDEQQGTADALFTWKKKLKGLLFMKALFALLTLFLAPSLLFAESIRCGSQIIMRGSTNEDLLAYCGKPTEIKKNGTYNGLIGNTYHGEGITSQSTGDFEVETWTYDFGPNQLMQRVRIENGVVVQIDSLGYGHNDS